MFLIQPFLMLLAAAGTVFLILSYYLQRRQAPELYFSATKFLPKSSPSRAVRSALPPLKLLVPIVILAIMTLALSQPAASKTQAPPLGLIIDDSAFFSSAQGQSPLRQIALAVASKISANTHWGVFTTSGCSLADGAGKEELTKLLQAYKTDSASTSYSPSVFRQAADLLKARTGAEPVLLLIGSTDTYIGYPGLDALQTDLNKDGIQLIPVSSQSSNKPAFIAVMDLPHLTVLNTQSTARIGIANTGKDDISGELRLMNGSTVLVRAKISVSAQSLSWEELNVTDNTTGLSKYDIVLSTNVAGSVDDKVTWDLEAFPAQTPVIIASQNGSNPGYIDKALKSSPLVSTDTIIEPGALDVSKLHQLLATTKLLVMDGIDTADFPNELSTEVTNWVNGGGTLVFTGGLRVNDTWNKSPLAAVLPATLKPSKYGQLQGITTRENAVTRNLELESVPLIVTQYNPVDTPPQQQVLITVGNQPMLMFKKVNQGTVFLWASTSDPRWNNWAEHPSFPVFWSNTLEYAISGDTVPVSAQLDATRILWRSATANSGENIYYLDYATKPVVLPGPLQSAIDKPVKSYHGYYFYFLAAGFILAAGYIVWPIFTGRRVRT